MPLPFECPPKGARLRLWVPGQALEGGGSSGLPDSAAAGWGALAAAQPLSAQRSVRPVRGLGYKEEEFSWSQYLRSTRAQAAPKHLFVSQSHVSAPEPEWTPAPGTASRQRAQGI